MIAIAVVIAALVAGAFIIKYWKQIAEWIQKAVNKIKEVLKVAVQGTRTFIMNTKDGFQNRSKYYHEDRITGEWEETVYTKQVDESEIPLEILAKVRMTQIDVEVSTTEDLQMLVNQYS